MFLLLTFIRSFPITTDNYPGSPKGRPSSSKKDEVRINHDITNEELRVIDKAGEMIGVIKRSEALRLAKEEGLDLVEVSPNAVPPVCKIIDYGKYKFSLQKKKAEAKKKQKVIEVKEIQLRPMIGKNDLDIKVKAIGRFIDDENKVKIVMRFRGREMAHQEIGMRILKGIQEKFEEVVKIELMPRLEGNQMIMIFAPAPERIKK
jgi:translation initiation factor IF-3